MKTKLVLSDKMYPAYLELDKKGSYTMSYKTDEFESFSKGDLVKLKEYVGDKFTFKTNAGVDLHTSEKEYVGIKVIKVNYDKL